MKNIRKRAASAIIAAVTVLSVGAASLGIGTVGFVPSLGIEASAATGVGYVNSSGAYKVCSSYTNITSATTKLTGGWYVVSGKVTIDGRLKVTDDSYIILTNGSKLTVKGGISVASDCKFNVYTDADSTASLYAGTTTGSNSTASAGNCGIGGPGAKVYIVGGNVYARGGSGSYGIQGDDIRLYWTNPTDSITSSAYKGTVTVYSPFADKANNAAYYNSTVSASALKGSTLKAATIVNKDTEELTDGVYAVFDKVNVYDRITVSGDAELYLAHGSTLTAEDGIEVSRGNSLNIYGNGGKLYAGTKNGSNFTASDNSAGIGTGGDLRCGEITINSGTVYANGGRYAAGIGGSNGSVRIYGGTVTAVGGTYGAGIGSGYRDNGADVKIVGGNVAAKGGNNASGIGSGYNSSRSYIDLSYTNASDSIYASSYSGTVNFQRTMYTDDGQIATASNAGGKTLTSQVSAYTVSFEYNGGNSISPMTVKANGYINSLPVPKRTGYTFAGWYTDRNFYYQFDNRYTAITQNITLYAKWVSASHTITFNSNGGTTVRSMTVADGGYMNTPASPTRLGYAFNGWYTDRYCQYLFEYERTRIYEDMTLYAGWIPVDVYHTVQFDSNGGTKVKSVSVINNGYLDPPTPPTRKGFTFTGWYIDPNCRYLYDYNDRVTTDLLLYAGWDFEDEYYTISYNSNGGTTPNPTVVSAGTVINQYSLPTPSKTGYSFEGWFEDRNCTNPVGTVAINSNVTFYAGWDQAPSNYYTISFNAMGGSYPNDMVVDEGTSVSPSQLPTTTRYGYRFTGWYEDKYCTYRYTTTSIYSNITLYAGWEPEVTTCTITFNSLGGSQVASMQVDYGTTLNQRSFDQPYRSGFSFLGWFDDYNCTSISQNITVNGNITLYAGWEQDMTATYTVRFYLDQSLIDTQLVQDGGMVVNRNGIYDYSWTTEEGYDFNPATMIVTRDLNLYASAVYYYGSTFGGAGLIAAIVGGVVLVGGGTAAGIIISKKKKNNK